jgi:hypothetical protein
VKVDDKTVQAWLDDPEATQPLVYFRGYGLATSRVSKIRRPAVTAVRDLYDAGMVDLVQRRIKATDEFEYLAIKRVEPAKIPIHFMFRIHELAT